MTSDKILLIFNFICPKGYSTQQVNDSIKQYLRDNKNDIIASLSHELKHIFDHNKVSKIDIPKTAKYQTSTRLIGDRIIPIHDFCFALYYMSVTETLVRPTEVASLIRSGEITKKGFLNFLKSNKTYQMLDEIRNMSYEKLRNDLHGYMDYIKDIFEDEPEAIEGKTDDEIIDEFLTLIRKFLQTNSIDYIENMIFGTSLPSGVPLDFIRMMGFGDDIQFDFLKKTVKNIVKYDDNKSFYETEIKENAKQANMVIRKLAKLYDIAK